MQNHHARSTPESGSWLRRMFQRRHLPKYLFVAATMATLAGIVAVVAGRRELQAQDKRSATPPAAAERAAAEKFVPPPVPDAQNFAATPFFAAIFEKRQAPHAAWPDDYSRAEQLLRKTPNLRNSAVSQKTGRLVTDLAAWQKAFEQSQALSGEQSEIIVSDSPERAANERAALEVLKALRSYEGVLEELRLASQRPQSRFNLSYDLENPWATLFPHLAVVKRTVQVLRLKASAELAAGHAEQAWRDTSLMLRLVEAPGAEPTLLSQLVRVACLNIAMQSIWEGLAERRWSPAQLQALQTRLQQFDFVGDLKRVLEAERAWVNLTIGMARDRRTPTFSALDPKSRGEAWKTEADRAFATCPREWFEAEQRNYNQLFDERLLAGFDVETRRFHPSVGKSNAEFVEATVQEQENLVKNHLVFAKEFLVAPSKVHLKLAHAQALTDFAELGCALERHRLATGRYPETLSVLSPKYLRYVPHDLIDGQPLRYERTEENGFLLYSIGWNESDEHGQPAFLASGRGTEINEGDWVWRYPTRQSRRD
jgi:hypothetical protein